MTFDELLVTLEDFNGVNATVHDTLEMLHSLRDENNLKFDIVIVFGNVEQDLVGDPQGMCGFISDFDPEREVKESELTLEDLHADCVIYSFTDDEGDEKVLSVNVALDEFTAEMP